MESPQMSLIWLERKTAIENVLYANKEPETEKFAVRFWVQHTMNHILKEEKTCLYIQNSHDLRSERGSPWAHVCFTYLCAN